MGTLTRKQREIRDREARILELARDMLLEQGYHGLSMDRIAEELEYSKGTIYQHFSSKEEVLVALANQALEQRLNLFRRAAEFRGRSRERLYAIGLAGQLFVRLYPHHFSVEQVIRLSSVWEKASKKRRDHLRACETHCVGVVSGVIRDALASGDLNLPAGIVPEYLVFGLWSISFGAYSIATTSTTLTEIGIADPFEALSWNYAVLLDGCGWRPLSTEFDYRASLESIGREVFSAEMRQSGMVSA
jgi:AcrR family transcriptional regulator